MKIKPDFDVAIRAVPDGINVNFARIPDQEIAALLFAIAQNPGVELPEQPQNEFGWIDDSKPCTHKERQRLYYWIKFSPVYAIEPIAKDLAATLVNDHGLKVLLKIDPPNNPPDFQRIVLTPKG